MTSLTTEDFPYTLGYVMELLGLEERELMSYVQSLALAPRKDEKTGRVIFTHRDIEVLKKALDTKKQGAMPDLISRPLNAPKNTPDRLPVNNPETESANIQKSGYMSSVSPNNQAIRSSAANKDNITVMVEAVSQVKEGILKDLSRLLDDKLSGLDEVVVELIRCKSENDSLKKKLDEAVRTKEALDYELSRFKPVQFGFYRKS
jgi:DNA-binding transcriptional MerR regulator